MRACNRTCQISHTAGGPNYMAMGSTKELDGAGKEVPGQRGYRCAATPHVSRV